MKITAQKARQKASDLLRDFGIARVPTPLSKIARNLQITIEYAPLDKELSGMAMLKDGQKFVWVNSLHHPNRQRFTLAHEIAHHILHADILEAGVHVDKGVLRRDSLSSQGTDDIEVQANAFASELLLPESEFERTIKSDIDLDDHNTIEALAKKFRVSTSVIHYRLMRAV